MAKPYRIFGSELSPYSVKVRSYFRYKGIDHEWVPRNFSNMEEFRKYAKLPLIPLVITPDDAGPQDSTPILEKLEALFPESSIHPADPTLAFLSALLEEYGDEWGNKFMFHYRWFYTPDQESAAERIARDNLPGKPEEEIRSTAEAVKARMVPRLSFVGSCEATKEQIEASFARQLAILDAHLAERPYVFGGRPAFGDFGLFPQLYECSTDPTPSKLIGQRAPRVLAWIERMLDPKDEGEFEALDALWPSLKPLVESEVGGLFLPWSEANARALAAGEKEFSVKLELGVFSQQTQKYHAKSLGVLRQRYASVASKDALDPLLEECGCLAWLRGA